MIILSTVVFHPSFVKQYVQEQPASPKFKCLFWKLKVSIGKLYFLKCKKSEMSDVPTTSAESPT